MGEPDRDRVVGALDGAYRAVTAAVEGLDEVDFDRPSRCAGWVVGDVLYHQLLDARRALCAFASPSELPADVDHVSYWRAYTPGGEQAGRHARHVRIAASAFSRAGLVREWRDTAEPAVRAARACPHDRVMTQKKVLGTADFVSTLVVEVAVHYLDLTLELPTAPPSDPASLALARQVLDGLLGEPMPAAWTDRDCVLKGSGRVPLSPADRTTLGPAAGKFPLLG